MTELTVLALKHDTDKASHGYCPHYERIIGDLRLFPITMIEIGVASGCSLRMWREWMPKARIYGFDMNGFTGDWDGFSVITGNQGNPHDLEMLAKETGRFHLVIDDGSHAHEDQKVSFTTLWPKLVSHGWYVIEDSFGIGSCIDLNQIGGGGGDIEEIHLICMSGGSVILFLKKR